MGGASSDGVFVLRHALGGRCVGEALSPVLPHRLALGLVDDKKANKCKEPAKNHGGHHALHGIVIPEKIKYKHVLSNAK